MFSRVSVVPGDPSGPSVDLGDPSGPSVGVLRLVGGAMEAGREPVEGVGTTDAAAAAVEKSCGSDGLLLRSSAGLVVFLVELLTFRLNSVGLVSNRVGG